MTQKEIDRLVEYCNDDVRLYISYGVPIKYSVKEGYFTVDEFYSTKTVRDDFPRDELTNIVFFLNDYLREILRDAPNPRLRLSECFVTDWDLINEGVVNLQE